MLGLPQRHANHPERRDPTMAKFGAAQPMRRVEDPRLLTGSGRYLDDIALDRETIGYVLRSPHAHARIVRMDPSPARSMPGVHAVYTLADLRADKIGDVPCMIPMKNRDGSDRVNTPRPALADGVVRHVGDPVAFVVADTMAQARDAAEAIDIEFDILPSSTELGTATDGKSAPVWPNVPTNTAFDWEVGDKAKTDALFGQAAHVTRLTVVNNRVVVASMEARAALASFDAASGRFTLYANTQGVWSLKKILAEQVFGVDAEKFHVITNDVGGGFGMKLFVYPEHILTCYASRKLGRPVRWISERTEAFVSDTHGRDNVTLGELAVDKDGRFLALRTKNYANMGAYLSTYAPFIPTGAGTKVLPSVYRFQAIHAHVIGVLTNTTPVDAYRGAGRPESNYLVERLIDQAASDLKIDRVELRKRNMITPAEMPWTSPTGATYDSGDFQQVMDAALGKIDWKGFEGRRSAAKSKGKLRGIGLAYYLEATGGGPTERAEIRFRPDGEVDLMVGTQSTGQGHETAYIQLTSERLGIDPGKIHVVQGDSDTIPTGGGTGGARSLYSEGTAILATVATVIEKGREAAADALEAAKADIEFNPDDGRFAVVGTDRGIGILELAAKLRGTVTTSEPMGLDTAETADIKAHTFPNGCHVAEVEVDPATGMIEVVRYLVMDDVGRAINPMIVRGQVHGGVAQGIGQAFLERTSYDPDSGQLLSGSFMDYAVPRAGDLPDIEVDFIEIPCGTNPLGVKGAGEAGAVGSPPAVVNALVDALRPAGVAHIDMPATPEIVWRAIEGARAA